MPITGHQPPKAFFSDDLPPGNSAPVHGRFPRLFELATEIVTYTDGRLGGNINFFSPLVQTNHARCVRSWGSILQGFFPTDRMIIGDHNDLTFIEWQDEALWTRHYSVINRYYRAARDELPAPDNEVHVDAHAIASLEAISLASINTQKGLELLTRYPVLPDIVVHGLTNSIERDHFEILLLGEIKQYPPGLDEPKHRLFSMGSLAQGLRYLAFGRDIFGSSYGLVAFGRLFRRMWLNGTTLFIDLGPGISQLEHLSLDELLLRGNGAGDDPSEICWDVGQDQGQQRLRSFFKYLGQQYINEITGMPNLWPSVHLNHPLGEGRIAVVEGFSVESLARAVKRCHRMMEAEVRRRHAGLLGGGGDGGGSKSGGGSAGEWPGEGKRGHPCGDDTDDHGAADDIPLLVASTSADTMSTSDSNVEIPPPPTSDTDNRLRYILEGKATDPLENLNDPQDDNDGLSPEAVDQLRKIVGAAFEGGEDVEALLTMF